MITPSRSLHLVCGYLGQRVHLNIDRPAGSRHPTHGFTYPVNYGYLPGVLAPDGDDLDAYYLISHSTDEADGVCIAVIHRYVDDDDKLLVVDEHDLDITDDEIHRRIAFQELPGHYEIIRTPPDGTPQLSGALWVREQG